MHSGDGHVSATFDADKQALVVAWDFSDGSYTPGEYYDYVYVYSESYADVSVLTNSLVYENVKTGGLKKGSCLVPVSALESDTAYFARWVNLESGSPEEKGSSDEFTFKKAERVDEDFCSVLAEVEDSSMKVVMTWEFKKDRVASSSHVLVVAPGDGFDYNDYYSFPMSYASGKSAGYIDVETNGNEKLKECDFADLRAYYVDISSYPYVIFGKSDEFSIDSSKFDASTWAASQQFNNMGVTRYQLQTARAKVVDRVINPLMTITPSKSKWVELVEKHEAEKESKKDAAAEKFRKAKPLSIKESKTLKDLDEKTLTSAVTACFKKSPGFLYLGAGVSVGAPSCAPSWWMLMQELLRLTFESVTEERHKRLVSKLGVEDKTRQPEEIMETFHFVLQEKLFDLFNLLELGAPNASHEAVAALAKAGKLRAVLTTNFDMFLERALDAASVPYKVYVTEEEFKNFDASSSTLALFKIHGTLAKSETIVAVANQYAGSGGLSPSKASVVRTIMRECPTLFMGYSGWDFEHQNYQRFWEDVGTDGGQPVFWLKRKNETGGPDLRRLIGQHIGPRLVIGCSTLPTFALNILKPFDKAGAGALEKNLKALNESEAFEKVNTERNEFVRKWIAKIPKAFVLTILAIEGNKLNKKMQQRIEAMKASATESDGTSSTDTNAMMLFYTTLGNDLSSGKITQAQYQAKLDDAVLDQTFAYMYVPKDVKREIKVLYSKALKSEKMLQDASVGATIKGVIPGACLSSASAHFDKINVQTPKQVAKAIFEDAMAFVRSKIGEPGLKKSDRANELSHICYMMCTSVQAAPLEDRDDAYAIVDGVISKSLKEKLDDEQARRLCTEANTEINEIAYGTVNMVDVLRSQLEEAERATTDAEFLDAMKAAALARLKNSGQLYSELVAAKSYMAEISQVLYTSPDRDVDTSVYATVMEEMQIKFPSYWKVAMARLRDMDTPEAKEIVAGFEAGEIEVWMRGLRYVGPGYTEQAERENNGYYPLASVPLSPREWLIARCSAVLNDTQDVRFIQPLLGALSALHEAARDIDNLKLIVDQSLQITGGKVGELTPVGIPDALAALYQEQGDFENASKLWRMALDGVATSVSRDKTDATVLNACLVFAKVDDTPERALISALTFSPQFSSNQSFGALRGAGRDFLVQQCAAWAAQLGYTSIEDAVDKLLR